MTGRSRSRWCSPTPRPTRCPPRARNSQPRASVRRSARRRCRPACSAATAAKGGIQEELQDQAASHPRIAQLQVIGQSVNGQDITAVRVTAHPNRVKPGKRPTTVYVGAQHAREWITPEMVRRLLDHVLDNYGTDRGITKLVNENELWFIPVANPDGYDFSFEDGQRLQRKNIRDNNGDGTFTPGEGVDLNRNSATRWGYDNEGSSPNPNSDTYRGPSPASEPETQALDNLFRRITPSSSSTTTRRPSCCCTGWGGRSPRHRRTTCSTRRWPAMTPTPPSPATTPTSPPSSTRPTATSTPTCKRRTERSGSLRRCRPARRRPPSTLTTRGCPKTARADSTSRTTRH